jgi:hypothetical protein
MPMDLVVLIVGQTFVAAAFHWAPRWGAGRFLFSVAVDDSFAHSDEARAILAGYRVRVWAHWIVSCAMVAVLHQWGPHVAPIGLLWLPLGAEVAFGAAQRRVRPHGQPSSSLRTADLSPRPALPGGRLAQSGPFLILAAVAYAVWQGRASIDALQAHSTRTFHPPPFGGAVAFVIGAAVCCGLLLGLASALRTLARHPSAASRRSTLLTLLTVEYLLAALTAAIFVPVSVARGERDLRLLPFVLLGLVLAFLVVIIRLTAMAAADAARLDPGHEDLWKWGLFYRNADDAALFVPKRVGLGYTLNFGRPEAWILAAILVVSVLGSVLLPVLLAR